LHEQPPGIVLPSALAGQDTAEHELEKKGLLVVAVTDPAKPALQEHLVGKLAPFELVGHTTAEHELAKKGPGMGKQ